MSTGTPETTIDHSRLPPERAGRASMAAFTAVAESRFRGWVETIEARHPEGEVYIGTSLLLEESRTVGSGSEAVA